MKDLLTKLYSLVKSRLFILEVVGVYYSSTVNEKTIDEIDIRDANSSNLIDILCFQDIRYIDVFQSFLDLGDRGYFAYLDDKCVHRSWVKSNEQFVYPHWIYPMKLKPNQHFIHYCETSPEARGRGIYPAVLSKIALDYKGRGEVLICIDSKNTASIKGAIKAGFVKKQRLRVFVICGIKFITNLDATPLS